MRAGGEIVYVAVGANLGDRDATFAAVIRAVENEVDLALLSASPVFETDPLGPKGQAAYLNAAIELRCWLSPSELLERLQQIERALGRDRSREAERWGPREVDLDILFFGDRCVDTEDLVIPHPRAHERAFVLRPLAAIAPRYAHPVLGHEVAVMAGAMGDAEGVRPWPRPVGWPGN